MMDDYNAIDVLRHEAMSFAPRADGLQALVDASRDARVVLMGEASHGTHDFYLTRAELTKALIADHGFNIVAVEADWPDAYRVNRWLRGVSAEVGPEASLNDFRRFPRWMWRNTDVVAFVSWLRAHNASRPLGDRTGFYGLDLYSLHSSMDKVLAYLDQMDPDAARRARQRYGCFEMFGEDPQAYGYASTLGLSRACEDEVTEQLVELRQRAFDYVTRDGMVAADEYFFAEQNARLVANAETYYRAMFGDRANSWNVRDTHMMETLEALIAHVSKTTGRAKAIVWAHNSHLGDARATEMSLRGELNVGQLVRERFAAQAFAIGCTTHTGTVTAVREWNDPAAKRNVRPSLHGSYERLFHDTGVARFLVMLRDGAARDVLQYPRLERAIGVIYLPETERQSHYFHARLPDQFDAIVHIDQTSAVEPLERWAYVEEDLPETYPSGM